MATIYAGNGIVNSYNPYVALNVSQSSQSIDGNYSVISFSLVLYRPSKVSSSASKSYSYTINGTTYSGTYKIGGSGTTTISSGTQIVYHNADGTKSISFSMSVEIAVTWGGTYIGTVSNSGSMGLSTIPRATTPTVSASSVDMGGSITINTPRASSGFTHDLAYAFAGSSYVSIATGVGTSYKWTVPDLASKIPNAASGTVTVRCITKSGSTTIGTKTVTFTAKVPASVLPSVSNVAHSEAASGLAAQFGAYIQNKTKLKVTVTAAGAKGSTVKEYQASLLNKTYDDQTFTTDLLNKSGTHTLKVRVKDSRGRWSDYEEVSVTVLAYSTPKIQALQVYRCDADGNADDEGTYMAVVYRYSVTSLGGKNTASMAVKYKRSTATSYTALLSGTALSADTTANPTTVFSTDYQFDIQMTVTDWFGATATANTVLPTAAVILDFKADGLGIAFGKVAEYAGIEFGWDIVDQLKTFGTMSGVYKTHDGLLLQWGLVSITPTAADTPTSVLVEYPEAYAETPAVFPALATSVPQNVSVGIQRTASLVPDTKKGIAVTLTRNGTTSTGVYWLAIGKGAA